MPRSHSPNQGQNQNIEGSSISKSQVQLGQAKRDLIQLQGSGNRVFQVIFNFFSRQKESVGWKHRNRQILLNKVRNSWVKGLLEKSLFNQTRLELGVEECFDVLDLDYPIPEQSRQPLPKGTKAIDKYDELGEGCTLLILGNPGSGKTTTLLELGRDLIARAEQNVDLPIPVVFNLSSWTNPNQQIVDWLVIELNIKYQVSKALGKTWIKNQDLLLLLDGLDEVKAELQDACVQAINQFHQDYGLTEIVVCSRIKDYEVLSHYFHFQTAIFVQSLTSDQVNDYLNRTGGELTGLRIALQTDLVLKELAKTPLMLNVMALAYQGVPVEKLIRLSFEERQKNLWDKYIERMFVRKKSKKYSNKQAINWLIWLSQKMVKDTQTVFLIEQMKPGWIEADNQKWLYRIFIWLFSTLSASIFLFVLFGISFLLEDEYTQGYILREDILLYLSATSELGLIIGLIITYLSRNLKKDIKPLEVLRWSWERFLNIFILIELSSIVIGILGPVFHLFDDFTIPELGNHDFTLILIFSFCGLILGFVMWIKIYRVVNLIWMLIVGSVGGFISYMLLWLIYLVLSFVFWIIVRLYNWSIFCLIYKFDSCFINELKNYIGDVLIFGEIGLVIGLIVGAIAGLSQPNIQQERVVPNQGIRQSAKNSAILAILGILITFVPAFIFGLYNEYTNSYHVYINLYKFIKSVLEDHIFLMTILSSSVLAGSLGGIVCASLAGIPCIQHLSLRFVFHLKDVIPWNYAQFLDWASNRLFLQKVGNGYIFVHRLLMEHFAQMEIQSKRDFQSD